MVMKQSIITKWEERKLLFASRHTFLFLLHL